MTRRTRKQDDGSRTEPGPADPFDGLEVAFDLAPADLIAPIYGEAERVVGKARSALDAEVGAAELVGLVSALIADNVPEEEVEQAFAAFVGQLIEQAQERDTPAALALLRGLSVVLPRPAAEVADEAAAGLRARGVPDRPWVARLGAPEPRRCWRYADSEGEQEAVYLVFAYNRREHFLSVLVDHQLRGGIKDCFVGDDPDRAWRHTVELVAEQPGTVMEEITPDRARAILAAAAGEVPCPVEEDQILDVAAFAGLVRSRLDLLDGRPPVLSALAPAGRPRSEPDPDGLLW